MEAEGGGASERGQGREEPRGLLTENIITEKHSILGYIDGNFRMEKACPNYSV